MFTIDQYTKKILDLYKSGKNGLSLEEARLKIIEKYPYERTPKLDNTVLEVLNSIKEIGSYLKDNKVSFEEETDNNV